MNNTPIDILLVEDNRDDEELTLLTLQENQIASRVEVVRDGAQALAYLFRTGIYADRDERRQPRLILLDLKLPKISGLQVLERVKSDARLRMIPVVILTSSKQEPDIERCYALGANSYIVKPVDFKQFSYVIRQVGIYWQALNEPPLR